MKKRTDIVLISMISALGICAFAVPVIKNHDNEFIPVIPTAVSETAITFDNKGPEVVIAKVAEYTGKVTNFRSARLVAPQDGVLEDWLIKPGQSVFELDRIAKISILPDVSNRRNSVSGTEESAIVSPARIFDSVQKSKERLHESVHATTSGRLTSTGVNTGDSIRKGETIGLVVDEQYSILEFDVARKDLKRINAMMGVEIHSSEYPSERFIGRILSKNKNRVRVEILNLPDYVLNPGSNATATFRF
ncbi:MAG: hypothetical protein ABW174_01070 [Flavitalea sp.]